MTDEFPTVSRIALCGLAAAVVHFAAIGVFNGLILSEDLRAWMAGAGTMLHPLAPPIAMLLWATMSACYGLIGLWYYAGISARRRGGPLTAFVVGLSLWVVTKATVALDLLALGSMPARIILGQTLGGLVAIVAAVVVGALLLDRRRGR